MPPRHPPHLWLMTDERLGDALWAALARLPRGSGVIFRHYSLPAYERRALFERVRTIARARRLVLVLAGSPRLATAWRADGVHGPDERRTSRPLLRTAPVHDRRERFRMSAADAIFVSPVFPTRSHPGARTLGRRGFAGLAQGHRRAIALGGMTRSRARTLPHAYGWAAIDAWVTRSDAERRP